MLEAKPINSIFHIFHFFFQEVTKKITINYKSRKKKNKWHKWSKVKCAQNQNSLAVAYYRLSSCTLPRFKKLMSIWKSDEKLLSFASLISPFKVIKGNIKQSTQCFITRWNISKFVINTPLRVVFQHSSQCFIWWWNTASHAWLPPQGFRPEGEIPRRHSSNSRVY